MHTKQDGSLIAAVQRPTPKPTMTANTSHPSSMPPASADLITTWAFLEEGVDHIMTKLQTGVSYSKVNLSLSL
jgi:cullin 1